MTARVFAVESYDEIARRLAEIEAERRAALSAPAEEPAPTLDDLLSATMEAGG